MLQIVVNTGKGLERIGVTFIMIVKLEAKYEL